MYIHKWYYGPYGGCFVPEILLPAILELEKTYLQIKKDKTFWLELNDLYTNYSWRPTPLYFASNLTKHFWTASFYVKREDLNHTWAHKINNVLWQILLARRMWKTRIITETGAWQNGLAVATVCAKFSLECCIYMWSIDVARQRPNVFLMERMWAKVIPVEDWTKTLKDAVSATLRDWITNVRTTHYCIWSALGPYPFPDMVRDFQAVIWKETKKQILKLSKALPSRIYTCVWGWSNSIWMFSSFLRNKQVELIWVEAWWVNLNQVGSHASRIQWIWAYDWIFQWYYTKLLQDSDWQISKTHSISAWLDYAWLWPQHCHLAQTKRVRYISASDEEAINAFNLVCKLEWIIPALESAHAYAWAFREASQMHKWDVVVINQSWRGDKDIFIVNQVIKDPSWKDFLSDELKRL